ncbi:hypothetical protein H4R34_003626 [Dimargaris verticillata]|uniref:Uncharacterized protein n=1 Tax=Dimargaris verticillata TaxID=2761393 RepID=A0A9W8B1X1_9FUNG|nr:hypothetical protein H4R34_003626 [Dimargaris verticillata]
MTTRDRLQTHRCLFIGDLHRATSAQPTPSTSNSTQAIGGYTLESPLSVANRASETLAFLNVRVSGILVKIEPRPIDDAQANRPTHNGFVRNHINVYYLDDGTGVIPFYLKPQPSSFDQYYQEQLEASLAQSLGRSVEVLGALTDTPQWQANNELPPDQRAGRLVEGTGCDTKEDVMYDVFRTLEMVTLYRTHYFTKHFDISRDPPPATISLPTLTTPTRQRLREFAPGPGAPRMTTGHTALHTVSSDQPAALTLTVPEHTRAVNSSATMRAASPLVVDLTSDPPGQPSSARLQPQSSFSENFDDLDEIDLVAMDQAATTAQCPLSSQEQVEQAIAEAPV